MEKDNLLTFASLQDLEEAICGLTSEQVLLLGYVDDRGDVQRWVPQMDALGRLKHSNRVTRLAGFPKELSDRILAGGGLVSEDGQQVTLAGEDLTEGVFWISFADYPLWIKAGVKTEIQLPYEDFKTLVKYFRSVDLRKHRMKRVVCGLFTEWKPRGDYDYKPEKKLEITEG